MAKPMLVTLPFVLLLLDYWPLRRMQGAGSGSMELVAKENAAGSRSRMLRIKDNRVRKSRSQSIGALVYVHRKCNRVGRAPRWAWN